MAVDRVTEAELSMDLAEVLDRVQRGERVAVERDGEVIAAIVPPVEKRGMTWGTFIDTYFDRPRPDDRFADDLEEIQENQQLIAADPEWPD